MKFEAKKRESIFSFLARNLHKMEVPSEGQDRLHHRCEQLAETKNQHQCDEILMENMKF